MTVDEACPFCAIGRGDDRSVEVVAEGADWIAFFPLDPATPGHTLVIPKLHATDLWALTPEQGAHVMRAVVRVGQAIAEALVPDGMNLISSAGSAAEQTVFHVHLHVVPRWERDGFGQIWPTGQRFRDESLEKLAAQIRGAVG